MQTIANSELVRIFMQRKKKMEKKNEQKAKRPNLAAPCLHAWIPGPTGQAWNDGPLVSSLPPLFLGQPLLPGPNFASWAKPCCFMGKTGISRGNFPEQIRDPLIRSGNHSNRFRHRIRRIFPDFFPNPFFPEKMISGREFRYSVSVGTGISRSRFHP